MNDNNPPKEPEEDKEVINEKEIGETRHDEEITAKGIVRSLFMANEPEQRKEVAEAEDSPEAESNQ